MFKKTVISLFLCSTFIMAQSSTATSRVIVKIKNDSSRVLSAKSFSATKQSFNVRKKIILNKRENIQKKSLSSTSRMYRKSIAVPKIEEFFLVLESNLSTSKLIKEAKNIRGFVYAEEDRIIHSKSTPNDSRFDEQWGLHNSSNVINDIGALKAWQVTKGSSNVIVGILDSGLDYRHGDLNKNVWKNTQELNGKAGVDDDNNGYVDDIYGIDTYYVDSDPMDNGEHGTHIAGIIGAETNNAKGIAGLNWKVKLAGCKCLDGNGDGYISDAVECINYFNSLKKKGENIVALNNSWGTTYYSKAMFDTIKVSNDLGIVFVATAGNESTDNDKTEQFPASYNVANIISVAASDRHGELADFTNYGKSSVDIAAPGVGILSTIPRDASRNDQYKAISGSSMSTAYVSGAVALLASVDKGLSVRERIRKIYASATKKDTYRGKLTSQGLLNVGTLLAPYAKTPPPKVTGKRVISRVSSDNDDAEESKGTVYIRSSDLELIVDRTRQQVVGLRFAHLAIPKGATIKKSYIEFQTDEVSRGACHLTIHGEKVVNAQPFTTQRYSISRRAKTIASVNWSPAEWGKIRAHGADQQSSDISTLIQEIVNQNGWQSGNAMGFIISGSGRRVAESFKGKPSAAPLFVVEYDSTGTTKPPAPNGKSVVYEDAEDKQTTGWKVYDNSPTGASITNVTDTDRNSRVLELSGYGRKNSYILGATSGTNAWKNSTLQTIAWKMKFSEKFSIYVLANTSKGKRYFYYNYGSSDKGLYRKKYIRIGLGRSTIKGNWVTIERDLAADLKRYEPDNTLLSVNGFRVKGSGRIDDIILK